MTLSFVIIATLTLAAGVAAMTLRNLVHCSLALVVTFIGLAAAYLQLAAQFVGFAQILVYVGAVAILIVFAVLLTRGGEAPAGTVFSSSWKWGAVVAALIFGLLAWAIKNSFASQRPATSNPEATVKQIGDALMNKYVLPLEVIGLLLTAALIGAVIIAMKDDSTKSKTEDGRSKVDEKVHPPSTLHPPSSHGGHT